MRRRGTFGGAIILLAVTLAACGSSQTSSTPAPTSASTTSTTTSAPRAATSGACASGQLAASYAGTQGATGHLEVTLALRNVSDHQCVVRGYPGVRLQDGSGHTLPLRVQRGHGFFPDTLPAPRPVTLAPGATAHFGVSFVTNNEYAGAHVCHTAAAAMSAPPGAPVRWQRVSLRRAPRISPCGSQLVVSPVYA